MTSTQMDRVSSVHTGEGLQKAPDMAYGLGFGIYYLKQFMMKAQHLKRGITYSTEIDKTISQCPTND